MGNNFAFINHERWYKIGQGTYASGIPCSFLLELKGDEKMTKEQLIYKEQF